MKKKTLCPKCSSPRFRNITGASIGDPLKRTFFEVIFSQCLKCGTHFLIETNGKPGRVTVQARQAPPRYDDEEENTI